MDRLLLILTELGYRLWLYGPFIVVILMIIARPIEEKTKPDPSSVESILKGGLSFTIPFYIGLLVPFGQLLSLVSGSVLLLRSNKSDVIIFLFILTQLYMILPGTVCFKTIYGIVIGMPLLGFGICLLLYKHFFDRKSFTFISCGILLITGAACFLTLVADDKVIGRIVGAICMDAVGLGLLEYGYYKLNSQRRNILEEKEPLLEPIFN